MSATRMKRYLPVQIAGQHYLIEMDVVLAVQQITDTESSPTPALSAAPGTTPSNATDDAVPVIDLEILFGGELEQPARQYAVIVATRAGRWALLVNTIRTIVSVEPGAVQGLPYLLTLTNCPFSAMIRNEEALLPVIDVTQLLDRVRTAWPELVTEMSYAG